MKYVDSYYVKFSKNNGWSWEYFETSFMETSYYYPRYIINRMVISKNDLKNFVSLFKTYEDCKQYNNKIEKDAYEWNREQYIEYSKKEGEIIDFINTFNKSWKK
jgi:hypothetical protein